ncbi:MAG: beta strand repeat-containing protein [Acidobacteriaceae bacterium]
MIVLLVGVSQSYATPATTQTTLTVTPGGSVTQGTMLTVQAAVSAGGSPVTQGSVTFYDGTKVLEQVQVVSSGSAYTHGTANFKIYLGAGSHVMKAVYTGTNLYPTSTSSTQTVTVTASSTAVTATKITASGSAGNYTLTGTVNSLNSIPPTGNVSFNDQTNSNYLLGTAALDPATRTSGWQSFTSYATGAGDYGVAMADLNGDGIPDLVTTNYNGTTMSVLLGNGDGTFKTHVDYAVPSNSFGIVIGDLNGDGIPDIVVANHGNSGLTVFMGNGAGTFQAGQAIATSGVTQYVAMGDFNGDGILDLVTLNDNTGSISVLLGNGDGSFQAEQAYGTTYTFTYGLAIADFNHDGKLDVAVADNAGSDVGVLLGNGDGTFQTETTYFTDSSPANLAVADLRGNGDQDLIVGYSQGGVISVLLGNGDGTFQAKTDYTGPSGMLWDVVAADVNGDGIPDIVASNPIAQSVSLFQGKGDGTLLPAVTTTTHAFNYMIAVGDLNGDGVPDVAAANLGGSSVAVSLGSITESATLTGVTVPGGGTHQALASYAGDANSAASTSTTTSLTGTPFTTTTSLTVAPNPATPGQSVALTASVSPSTGAGYTATGTVSFYDGTTPVGTPVSINASSGQAVLPWTGFTTGSHNISAIYAGDTNFTGSTSAVAALVVNKQSQTITFPTLGTATYGAAPITLSASASSSLPVTFSLVSGPATLTGNVLTITGAGNVVVQASQAGNNAYDAATAVNQTLTVAQAPLAVTAASATRAYGAPNPTFTGAVTGAVNGDSFTETFSTTAVQSSVAGNYPIVPTVVGAKLADYAVSTTNGTLTVTKAGSSVVLASSASTQLMDSPITFTAQVVSATSGMPSGMVSFFDGSTLMGAVPLDASGQAVFTTSSLSAGLHAITAAYAGDSNFTGSTSAGVSEKVVDFSLNLGVGGSLTQTVLPGGTAVYSFTVTPSSGTTFLAPVTLTASGLPAGATYTFSPATIPAGNGATNVTLTIQTTTQTAQNVVPDVPAPRSPHSPMPIAMGFLLLPLVGLKSVRKRMKQMPRMLTVIVFMALSLGAVVGLSGCGAGGFFNQKPQTYAVTVTATSGALQHSTNVTLTVE